MKGAILVLGGKKDAGKSDDAPAKDDGDEKPTSGAQAREEAVKAMARGLGVTVKNWQAVDKALQAWCKAAGYGDMDDADEE